MLYLLFQLGEARYALDTSAVREVAPSVPVRPLPHAPPGVAGLLDYHGVPVPVLDLCALATNQPAQKRFSTRLILVRLNGGETVGLLAERATTLLRRKPEDFARTGLHVPDAPFLGAVTTDGDGFIHQVNVEGLLTGSVRALLALPAPEEVPR